MEEKEKDLLFRGWFGDTEKTDFSDRVSACSVYSKEMAFIGENWPSVFH